MPEDFFTEEARIARQALRNLAMETGKTLQRDADIRPLITKRPFASLAAAAGGGLVAGLLLTPRRKSAEEKARIRALRQEAHAQKKVAETSGHGLMGSLVDAVKPALNTLAASAAGMIFQNVQNSSQEQAAHAAAEHVSQAYQGPPRDYGMPPGRAQF